MKKKLLGSTDLLVSEIGLGTVKFGRNQSVKYPQAFELPTDEQIIELLALAKNNGINVLDTAPAYGCSEERIGNLFSAINKQSIGTRHDWIWMTKVGEEFENGESIYDFTPEHGEQSLKRSLKKLNTDYLDIVLVHSNGEDIKIIQHFGLLDYLEHAKKQGFIRSYGMSTKTIEGGLLAVDKSDVVMVTYNPHQTEEKTVIQYAHQKNKGIFIKKGLASGHLDKLKSSLNLSSTSHNNTVNDISSYKDNNCSGMLKTAEKRWFLPVTKDNGDGMSASSAFDPIKATFQFILNEPGVTSIIMGTVNPQHLLHNIKCLD